MIHVGIIGAAGLSGIELLKWLKNHTKSTIKLVTSSKYEGQQVNKIFPELNFCSNVFESNDSDVSSCDVVFLAVPNEASLEIVPKLLNRGVRVIDLSGAFRLKDVGVFSKFYNLSHNYPELLEEAVFGLPEYFREKISKAKLVANPGCYSTAALLGILPLAELIEKLGCPPIIDSKSGVSGAGGRVEDDSVNYVSVNENFKSYKLFSHQHQPEIQQYLSELSPYSTKKLGEVIFTPHLLPVNRGILSTIYLNFSEPIAASELRMRFEHFSNANKFIHFLERDSLPELKMTLNSNYCMIGAVSDESEKNWIILTSIDNLVKGASGQAIQNMNLMFGMDEYLGLF